MIKWKNKAIIMLASIVQAIPLTQQKDEVR